jgi:hypothetical protein
VSVETCPKCGTSGEWIARDHETLGGLLDCIALRAGGDAELVGQVGILRDYARLRMDNALGLPTAGLD